MRRRSVLSALVLAWPRGAAGQPAATAGVSLPHRIGVLDLNAAISEAGLRRGLAELGYIEGRNIAFEARYADGRLDRLPLLAMELLRSKPDLIASATTQAIQAVRRIDATVPVVMTGNSDPIGSGLIESLSRPGGSTTGVTLLSTDAAAKRLALLKEALPAARRVAIMAYRGHPPTALLLRDSLRAALVLGLELHTVEIEPSELDGAFAALIERGVDALVVQQFTGLNPVRARIAHLALGHRLPVLHESRAFVEAGGLISYGASPFELGRRAAGYVDRILKGARPGDLPVEQPTKFELVVNAKTAAILGVSLPPSFLARADEVIE